MTATYRIDERGTLEMKLARAEAAAKYARTKAERERATKVAAATRAKLAALAAAEACRLT